MEIVDLIAEGDKVVSRFTCSDALWGARSRRCGSDLR
jgi:hypothetical protein